MVKSAIKRGARYRRLRRQQGWSPSRLTEGRSDINKTKAAWGVMRKYNLSTVIYQSSNQVRTEMTMPSLLTRLFCFPLYESEK